MNQLFTLLLPYQLAKPADVTLTIYGVNGQVVRELALGHQATWYQSRSGAAYLDGRNAFGKPVVSGCISIHSSPGISSCREKW